MDKDNIVKMPIDPWAREAIHIGVDSNEWYLQSQKDERFNIKSARADLIKDHKKSIDRFERQM